MIICLLAFLNVFLAFNLIQYLNYAKNYKFDRYFLFFGIINFFNLYCTKTILNDNFLLAYLLLFNLNALAYDDLLNKTIFSIFNIAIVVIFLLFNIEMLYIEASLMPLIFILINLFKKMIGGGDIEYIYVIGLLLGFKGTVIVLFFTSLLALPQSIYFAKKEDSIAMLPYLAITSYPLIILRIAFGMDFIDYIINSLCIF